MFFLSKLQKMEKYNITPQQKEQIRSLDDQELKSFYEQVSDLVGAAQSNDHEKINKLEEVFSFDKLVDREDSYTDVDYINSFRTEAYSELSRRRSEG
jgi:hypothetical protein